MKDDPGFTEWFEACVDAQRLKAASPTGGAENVDDETQRVELPLPYKPFAKQDEFHKCKAKYKLFGGAAGPGKSKALLMEAIVQATNVPNVNTLLLRRTFPELEGSLLLYFRRDVPRELYRSFNEAKHTVTWHNGSTTRFGYSQSENDIYQYQSGEYLFIGVDELTHFTLRQWQFLTSRNRCPVADAFPNMAGATNPGNIGHAWVKALFVDKQPAAGMDPREYDAKDYAFIAARVWDNPIYANDASYLKTLEKLPDSYRRAFLEGDWSVFAGQYFTNFDPSRSVIRAESIAAETWWPRWISIDWGFEHPAAIYWHTSAPTVESRQRRLDDSHTHGIGCGPPAQNAEISRAGVVDSAKADGDWRRKTRVITYRECVEQHLAPRALAAEIVARSRDREGKAEHIDAIYLSPDAFAHHTDESSIAERLSDALAAAGFPRPVPADNDRVSGWMLMYEMLEADEWQIADSCPELIRTLPELVRDTANVEDIAKREGDDAADAARYGLKTRASGKIPKPPREQEIHARVTSDDPTIRAIQARKAELEVPAKNRPVFAPWSRWRRNA
ncbi:MAG TPA: phage terminase large subunit [Candidatus Acidoferrales bacterium]|nr:phage terminase large subunit [Candidatus Acidoferrales bacterium]